MKRPNSLYSIKIAAAAAAFFCAFGSFAPSAAFGENSLTLHNGLEIILYSPEDILSTACRDELGRLIFELPGGVAYILIEDIDDPQIANKGDGAFHPMKVEWVLDALSVIDVSGNDIGVAASVYVLPYPRSGFPTSTACGTDIFLSPGVFEISRSRVAWIVTHELGHVFQRRYAPEARGGAWEEYLEVRGITDTARFSADAAHMNRPVEIFAEDFRYLFGGPEACVSRTIENPDLPLPDEVPGLEQFFVSLVAGERVVSIVTPAPLACAISNYPNPFNPTTTIRAALSAAAVAEPGGVSLAVYRVDGSLVRELHRGPAAGGDLEARWDGKDERGNPVSSGMYLCRVRAGRFSAAGKMLLIR
jgi:hypothetical protein